MALFRHSTFAFAILSLRMGELKLLYLLTYLTACHMISHMRNDDSQVRWSVAEGRSHYFLIVSRLTGFALAVHGANRNLPGAQVIPLTKTLADNFLWYEDYQSGTIRSALNDFCLEAEGNVHKRQAKKEPL